MAWRGYVISNIFGQRKVMRDTTLYPTKEKAISALKIKNKKWMELNYNKQYTKQSNFEYGAYQVPSSGYKYQKGTKGNNDLLNDIRNQNPKKGWFFG